MAVTILENAFRFKVSAPLELGRHALPHLLSRGCGAIVNIGSMSGMQNELAPRVRVNAILPVRGHRVSLVR